MCIERHTASACTYNKERYENECRQCTSLMTARVSKHVASKIQCQSTKQTINRSINLSSKTFNEHSQTHWKPVLSNAQIELKG